MPKENKKYYLIIVLFCFYELIEGKKSVLYEFYRGNLKEVVLMWQIEDEIHDHNYGHIQLLLARPRKLN